MNPLSGLPAVKSLRGCRHLGLWGSHPLIPRQQRGHSVLKFMACENTYIQDFKTALCCLQVSALCSSDYLFSVVLFFLQSHFKMFEND